MASRGANTIAQRIALEGGEEIKRELQKFGFAGEKVFKGVQAEAQKLTGPPRTFFSRLREGAQELTRFGKSVQQFGRDVGRIGAVASASITAPLAAVARTSLQAFDAQARAQAQVEAAVRSTGQAAGFSAGELFKMASGLQEISRFGDENILQNVTAPLLTFTNIAGDVFERAQTAVLDVSTALQTDLKSAALQVGKALNDPIKGLGSLSEAGIQFTDQQKELIKSLVETGRLAEAQGVILDEFARQFGGSAVAAVQAGTGALDQLRNSWGDFLEQIGEAVNSLLPPLVQRLRDWVKALQEIDPETKRFVVTLAGIAAAGAAALGVLGLLAFAIGALFTAAGAVVGVVAALAAGIGLAAANSETFRTFLSQLVFGNQAAEQAAKAHGVAVDKLRDALENVKKGAPGAISALAEMSKAELRAGEAAVAAAEARVRAAEAAAKVLEGFGANTAFLEAERAELEEVRQSLRDTRSEILRLTNAALRELDQIRDVGGETFNPLLDNAADAGEAIERTTEAVRRLKVTVTDPSLNQASIIEPGKLVTSKEKVEEVRQNIAALLAQIRDGGDEAATSLDAVGDADVGAAVDDLRRLNEAIEPVGPAVHALLDGVHSALLAISKGGTAEFEAVAAAAEAAAGRIGAAFSAISGAAGDTALPGGASADDLGGGGPFAGLTAELERLQALIAAVDFSALRTSGGEAFAALQAQASEATAAINAALQSIGSGAGEQDDAGGGSLFAGILAAADAAWQTIRAGAEQLGVAISAGMQAVADAGGAAFTAMGQTITGVFASAKSEIDQIASQIRSTVASLIAEMKRLEAAAKAAASAVSSAQSSGGGASPGFGFARGGYLATGPGTSTSDSIIARLSRGEFVISAAAVRRYGVGFLDALNRMKLTLPAFTAGGLADQLAASFGALQPVPIPSLAGAFAGAGAAGPSGPVLNLTLDMGSGRRETFPGLTGPRETMDALIRAVHVDQLGSAGRKPGWYK